MYDVMQPFWAILLKSQIGNRLRSVQSAIIVAMLLSGKTFFKYSHCPPPMFPRNLLNPCAAAASKQDAHHSQAPATRSRRVERSVVRPVWAVTCKWGRSCKRKWRMRSASVTLERLLAYNLVDGSMTYGDHTLCRSAAARDVIIEITKDQYWFLSVALSGYRRGFVVTPMQLAAKLRDDSCVTSCKKSP